MEARPDSHPPDDVLLALGSGKLDDATAEAIFFHVEACSECLKTAGQTASDSFFKRLKAARGAGGTPAPRADISSFPDAWYTDPALTTEERPAPSILPELRDHPQYEVIRELGRGGMGVVYLAKNKLMDRPEVLKVVNKKMLGEAGAAERFLREIRSAAQLNHPNIVTAYSALQVGDLLLFSMEYIEGQDLAQLLKTRGPVPAAHAGSYILQAARGLQHAFEKGMVHRDIKPQNLILDAKKNVVKILDFGLAKATRTTFGEAAEGLTGMNMMMGTPDYMAPEQARDAANVDIRADVYSLGCTLYYLLTGRTPFVGGSLAAKIAAQQLSEPDPVESLRQDLPPGLAEAVRKMMAKDPAQRYQRPAEVVQALTFCFRGRGIQPTAMATPVNVVTAMPVAAPSSDARVAGRSIYEQQTVAPVAVPPRALKESPSPLAQLENEAAPGRWKIWLIVAAAAGAAVLLILLGLIGLWIAGVFQDKPDEPHTAKPSAAPAANAEDGKKSFTPLFDGKDLKGWQTHPSQPGNWRVVKGVLSSSGVGVNHLYTERGDFTDFDLRLQARIHDGGAGAGVVIRAPFGPSLPANIRLPVSPSNKLTWVSGYNAKMDARRLGGLLVDLNPELHRTREPVLRLGEWINYEISAEDNHFIIKVNGETTSDYTDEQRRHMSGHIVLQQYGTATAVEFREIEIKELTHK